MGFRSIAWEEDWTVGRQIDEYIRTGEGDLDALVSEMSPQWQSRQVADVLRWLRDYNAGRADVEKVQFVGVEYYLTRQRAHDAVDQHVAGIAPEQLAASIRTRGLPDRGPDAYMDGGSPTQWFDVIVHRQEVTPTLPFPAR